MNIVNFLLPIALVLGGVFAAAFVTSVIKGQYDDLETPARKILLDDENENSNVKGLRRE